MRVYLLLGAALAILAARPAAAARIELGGVVSGATLVFLTGSVEAGDDAAFLAATAPLRRAVVILDSRGGALEPGLAIGRAVRERGFSTLVGKDRLCASVCALIWLAGPVRHAADSAVIGFHAVYRLAGGGPVVSSVGNARAGAYLARLGFSDSAITFATAARPSGMSWLKSEPAAALGITVTPLPEPLDQAAEQGPSSGLDAAPEPAPPAPVATYRGSILASGRRVPLPPGEWTEVLNLSLPAASGGLDESEIALVRRVDTTIDAFILIRTADRRNGGVVADWGRSPICTQHERLYLLVTLATPAAQDCAQLDHVVLLGDGPPTAGWGAALAVLATQAEPVPQTFLAATYRFAGGASAASVTYLFATEQFGFAGSRTGWRDSPWHPDHLDGARRQLVERFRLWLEANQPAVRAGILAARETSLSRLP